MNHTTAPRCPRIHTKTPRTVLVQDWTELCQSQLRLPSQDPPMPQLPIHPVLHITGSPPLMILTPLQFQTRAPSPTPPRPQITSYPPRKTKQTLTKVSSAPAFLKRGPRGGQGGATQAQAMPPTPSKVTRHSPPPLGLTGPGHAHQLHRAADGQPAISYSETILIYFMCILYSPTLTDLCANTITSLQHRVPLFLGVRVSLAISSRIISRPA